MKSGKSGTDVRGKTCLQVTVTALLIVFLSGGITAAASGQDMPILAPRCYVPDSLHFDEALDSYVPNPFTVRLTTYNKGSARAHNVTATFMLPEGLEFDPPGQPQTKTFNPSILPHWNIGDPVPELTWSVRWTKRHRHNDIMKFRWTVTGESPTGVRLDSAEVRCDVPVPGLLPLFACGLAMPDSLPLNADETDMEPNPFTVSYTVRNTSFQVGKITCLDIDFPAEDLYLSPTSPNPISQPMDLTLDKGESATFDWVIDVKNRITRRNVRIAVVAIDDEGNPIECSRWLPIANLRTALLPFDLRVSDYKLRFVPETQSYDPSSFVVTAILINSGGADLHNVTSKLMWCDQSGLDLIELDPGFPDNTNPKTRDVLFPKQSVSFEWGFRLKNKNTSAISQFMEFDATCGSDETPTFSNICLAYVEIEPVITTDIEQSEPPRLFRLAQNHPNPFDVSTTIAYELERSATIRLVVHDMLGRQVAILTEGEMQAGLHRIAFDGSSLPDGVYIYTLQAEGKMHSKQMVLIR